MEVILAALKLLTRAFEAIRAYLDLRGSGCGGSGGGETMLSEERMAEIAVQFENDSWDWRDWEGMENPEGDPVYIQVPMTVDEVIRLDRRASERGKTRTQLVRELLAL